MVIVGSEEDCKDKLFWMDQRRGCQCKCGWGKGFCSRLKSANLEAGLLAQE